MSADRSFVDDGCCMWVKKCIPFSLHLWKTVSKDSAHHDQFLQKIGDVWINAEKKRNIGERANRKKCDLTWIGMDGLPILYPSLRVVKTGEIGRKEKRKAEDWRSGKVSENQKPVPQGVFSTHEYKSFRRQNHRERT